MLKSGTIVCATALFAFSLLVGCNKTSGTEPKSETVASPALPDKSAVPDSAATGTAATDTPAAPAVATAGADVSVGSTEARAGDVSVKLPQ